MTSYQGGHVEFFKYMHDLLAEAPVPIFAVFGGGGGTILPERDRGSARPTASIESTRPMMVGSMGLAGNDQRPAGAMRFSDRGAAHRRISRSGEWPGGRGIPRAIGQLITLAENYPERVGGAIDEVLTRLQALNKGKLTPVLGITGTGGSGKSSLVDELVRRFPGRLCTTRTLAVVSVGPFEVARAVGALLGDRIRMNAVYSR